MSGRTVAILESRSGAQLAELVRRRGWTPLLAPALAEVPDMDSGFIAGFVGGLETRPAVAAIFQTGVGTRALFEATDALGLTPKLLGLFAAMTVVVRGPKPAAVLRARGVRIDLSAAEPFTTMQVLAAMRDVPVEGARVVVQRYGATNEKLEEALHARRAEVVEVPTYRWALPADTAPLVALMDALAARTVDAVVFTSASQAYNLFGLADALGRRAALADGLNRSLVASVGPVCTAALAECGVTAALEASPPKMGPLVAALEAALAA
ncbi:MAG: uroporphyrinogen-III synthase [Proteobacteria bacterium]|nr:uroporphyrinogen-III synthase [Pseudomonadota bacterium]